MQNPFREGFMRLIPVLAGVIPFGIVMGSVTAAAGLTLVDSTLMNIICYAGAAQLAAFELMSKQSPVFVVVLTGLIINLRFLLYSASMAYPLRNESFGTKLVSAHLLTDQPYAVMAASDQSALSQKQKVQFYLGATVCMAIGWHLSVIAGFLFGNFAPKSWALDFAIPLSFIAVLVPTLKTRLHVAVGFFATGAAIIFHEMPFGSGLIVAVITAMGFAAFLTRKKAAP